jgi:hypothetical protein
MLIPSDPSELKADTLSNLYPILLRLNFYRNGKRTQQSTFFPLLDPCTYSTRRAS